MAGAQRSEMPVVERRKLRLVEPLGDREDRSVNVADVPAGLLVAVV